MIICTSRSQAWEVVTAFTGCTVFDLDLDSSKNAGYPVYRQEGKCFPYVCDLNTRFEINTKHGSKNIWLTGV